MATGVGLDPMGKILSTMWTHAVRSTLHPIIPQNCRPSPQAHDMCYDTIDKSGLCDPLHPALVTYKLELTENGKEACTDCSEDNEDQTGGVSAQESSKEAGCHCKVNILWSQHNG